MPPRPRSIGPGRITRGNNMKTLLLPVFSFCLLAAAGAAPACAQSEVLKVDWEVSKLAGQGRAAYVPVTELRASPDLKFTDRVRAVITLRNPDVKTVEGLVLRYSLRLRLLRNGDAESKAFWGVPFRVEEVRVSRITPASEKQVQVMRFELAEQLHKLSGSGFYPTAIKIEVMLCPRQGDVPDSMLRESELEILKP